MHADRLNRFALALFGLLVLLAGTAAMVASAGGFGATYKHRALIANEVSHYIGAHGAWLWWAIAGACVIIALLALRWILALLISTDRAGDLPVGSREQHGTTVVQPAALTGALCREIGTYRGVDSARGWIIGEPTDPCIVVLVTASPSADLAGLHRRLESEAFAHVRQALGKPALPIQLDLDVRRRT